VAEQFPGKYPVTLCVEQLLLDLEASLYEELLCFSANKQSISFAKMFRCSTSFGNLEFHKHMVWEMLCHYKIPNSTSMILIPMNGTITPPSP
jgi:hypothetical protein